MEIAAIVERGRGAYDQDVALRRAIERCLEFLGEDQEFGTVIGGYVRRCTDDRPVRGSATTGERPAAI